MNKEEKLEKEKQYIENILQTWKKISIEISSNKKLDKKIKELSDY